MYIDLYMHTQPFRLQYKYVFMGVYKNLRSKILNYYFTEKLVENKSELNWVLMPLITRPSQ